MARKAALPAQTLCNAQTRRDLARQLRRDRPDVVHVHNTFPLISPSVLHACRDAGVPVVVTFHNYKLSAPAVTSSGTAGSATTASTAVLRRRHCTAATAVPRLATVPVVAGMRLNRRSWQQLVSPTSSSRRPSAT